MTNVQKKNQLFLHRVREQALRNRIKYKYECIIFYELGHLDYMFLNKFFETNRNNMGLNLHMKFFGPGDYIFKDDTECRYITIYQDIYQQEVFVLPLNWLLHYDPSIPIYRSGYHICYLDLGRGQIIQLPVSLVRNKFYPIKEYSSNAIQYLSPYVPRNCDRDWCMTYSKRPPSFNDIDEDMIMMYMSPLFTSILLIKNVDFSKLDAYVESKGIKCPNVYCGRLKPKYKKSYYIWYGECIGSRGWHGQPPCLCVNCRKDHRAFEVGIIWVRDFTFLDIYGSKK